MGQWIRVKGYDVYLELIDPQAVLGVNGIVYVGAKVKLCVNMYRDEFVCIEKPLTRKIDVKQEIETEVSVLKAAKSAYWMYLKAKKEAEDIE